MLKCIISWLVWGRLSYNINVINREILIHEYNIPRASQVALVVKNLPANPGDTRGVVSIPVPGRSPGVGNGNNSSILAWKIPWTEEPGRLSSMGLQRVGHKRVTDTYLSLWC